MTTPLNSGGGEAEPALNKASCAFLRIAAELRNKIYDIVVEDTTKVRLAHRGRFITPASLASVNHQIRDEFMSRLPNKAAITAYVSDFDFEYIMKQFSGTTSDRSLTIILSFIDHMFGIDRNAFIKPMDKWVAWVGSRDHIRTEYVFARASIETPENWRPYDSAARLLQDMPKWPFLPGYPRPSGVFTFRVEHEKIFMAARAHLFSRHTSVETLERITGSGGYEFTLPDNVLR